MGSGAIAVHSHPAQNALLDRDARIHIRPAGHQQVPTEHRAAIATVSPDDRCGGQRQEHGSTAARLRTAKGDQPAIRYISSRSIRQQLYGGAGDLGSWREVEAVIQQELCEALAAGETAIVEASYTKRDFRLAITQAMALPAPVQWIGWWLDTPVQCCLEWNQQRDNPVPDAVIQRQCAQLLQSAPVPHRKEGFCHVVRLQPALDQPLAAMIRRRWMDWRARSSAAPTAMPPTSCTATPGYWTRNGCYTQCGCFVNTPN